MGRSTPRLFSSFFLVALCLFGQRDLGTITGTVTDAQGGVIPAAKVTIVETATGVKYDVNTSATGVFVRPTLPPGTYTVTVEAPGFRRITRPDVVLKSGERVGVDLQLLVGDVSQAVEVSATQAPLLQTESVIVGASLDQKMVGELPLGNQRTFTFLARLTPGVLPAESGARDANGGGFSANGIASSGQNNFLLNGVDNNVNNIDLINQTSFAVGPPPEAIGEMTVLTNANSAEYGRAAGGVINVNMRAGTNAYHGNLWEIFQNQSMNANRWENNFNNTQRGVFKQNQFGAALGGPVLKNRTFFFGDYQGTRLNSSGGAISGLGSAGFSTIPTILERTGNFSEFLTSIPVTGAPALIGQIFDPLTQAGSGSALTRTAFPNNIIPASRIDPAAAKIAKLWPEPNVASVASASNPIGNACVTAACYPNQNFYNVAVGTLSNNTFDIRIDHTIDQKNRLFGQISWGNRHNINNPRLGPILDGTGFSAYNENSLSRNAQLGYTRVWSASTITETRVAFSRLLASRYQATRTLDVFKEFGIGGFDGNTQATDNGGLFAINLGNYTAIGGANYIPSIEYSDVWDFIQNVSIAKSSHSIKFGFEYKPVAFPFFQYQYPRGSMTFSNNDSSVPLTANTANSLTGDGFASFLLGRVNSGVIQSTNFMNSIRRNMAWYFQDDWKVTPRLTINLGLRYELASPVGDKFNDHSNFSWQDFTLYIPEGKNMNNPLPSNLATVLPQLKVERGTVSRWLVPWDKWDIGPRIGFAYSFDRKTVVRAGFGMFYSGEENRGGCCSKGLNPPFNNTANFARVANGVNIGTFDANPAFPGGFSSGFPASPYTYPASPSLKGFVNDFRNGMVQKWNLSIQRELPRAMSLEIGYTGNHQSHGLAQWDPNVAPNSCGGPGKPALGTPECIAVASNSSLTSTNQKIVPNLSGASQDYSFAFGNYNAGTVKFEKRLDSDGLMLLASYTLSHSLVDGGTPLSSGGPGRTDPYDWSTGYGNASQDSRHNWTTGFAWDIPVGKGRKYFTSMGGFAEAVVGNWQMNGIWTFRPWGQPYSLSGNCTGIWASCRVDLLPGKNPQNKPDGGRRPDKWFATNTVALAASGTYGNMGGNIMYAPPTDTLDLSLAKGYKVRENYLIQFRAEAINFANTPQFSNPNGSVTSANFGKITSTRTGSERHLQFSLRIRF